MYRFDSRPDIGIDEDRAQDGRILQLLHERIQKLAESESCFGSGEKRQMSRILERRQGKRGRGAGGKTKVFGMKKREVYTQVVSNCSASELVPIIKKLALSDSTIYSDEWRAYDGLVSAGYKRHYRVAHSEDVFANGRAYVDGIENFWGVAKSRMDKMGGIRKDKFNLHLKETEWRFNHRGENIYRLLLLHFKKSPSNLLLSQKVFLY